MPPENYEQLLDRAAALCGIEPDFWDIWGRHHFTSRETKEAIVRSAGRLAHADAESIRQFVEGRARREWERLIPPAVIAVEADELELPVSIPSEFQNARLHLTVRREDGETAECEIGLNTVTEDNSADLGCRTYTRNRARLPLRLPLGYHDVTVRVGDREASTRYIVTPERAFVNPRLGTEGRAAGIAISLY